MVNYRLIPLSLTEIEGDLYEAFSEAVDRLKIAVVCIDKLVHIKQLYERCTSLILCRAFININ
ncbi:hypothetical protein DDT56_22705 [Brenneria corticis]|uniref:Uncharacterized protein n=1 Tax=Brenneria corticis TaxID=2173106 RepID=A0A2U1TKZ9_9GAMM|nr:hypothetical protein DDT56_22705 [Brenneria sp. CFCC 11842]